MKKAVKILTLGLFLFSVAFTYSSYYFLGLDDDGFNEIDPVLETKWPDEEIGFKEVAGLIASFVKSQHERRELPKNLEKYQNTKAYTDLPQNSYATRDVHRKAHGCFQGDITIHKDIAQNLKTRELGIFKPGAQFDAVVRLSNGHPQNRDDRAPDARGFAVKFLPSGTLEHTDIENQNSSELNSSTVLDILTINFPTFFVDEKNTALKYFEINESFLKSALDFTGTAKSKIYEGLSLFTTGINTMELQQALAVNGSIIKTPLFQEYFSMVPSRLGLTGSGRAVKYIWTPSACPGQEQSFAKEMKTEWPEWSKKRNYADPLNPLSKRFLPPYLPFSGYESNNLRKNVDTSLKQEGFWFTHY